MVGWLKFNIIEKIPFMVHLEIQCITFKTETSFIAHPWIKLSVVGLEVYSAHDWRAATSVQRAPVTWREWGLWSLQYTDFGDTAVLQSVLKPLSHKVSPMLMHQKYRCVILSQPHNLLKFTLKRNTCPYSRKLTHGLILNHFVQALRC